jgi:hypothetical protein
MLISERTVMKEIKIIQDNDGNISIERMGGDGNPTTEVSDSIDSALETIKSEFGGGIAEESTTEPIDDSSISASKGKTLEENIPAIPPEKKGMMPKKSANWMDYGV